MYNGGCVETESLPRGNGTLCVPRVSVIQEYEVKKEEEIEEIISTGRCSERRIIVVNLILMVVVICIFVGAYALESSKVRPYMELQHEMIPTTAFFSSSFRTLRRTTINTSVVTTTRKSVITTTKRITRTSESRQQTSWRHLRLPQTVIPNAYTIELDVDMKNDVYKGNVTIDVKVINATNFIMLHALELDINDVIIVNKKNTEKVTVNATYWYAPNEFFIIETSTNLKEKGEYRISIRYNGLLRNDMNGFYKSFYKDGKKRRKVASTFFSPISARKAFPCFDEPIYKANFTLVLTHSDQFKSQSNMEAESTCQQNNKLRTVFQTSLKMSTYLVCWVISEYDELKIDNGRISGWAGNVDDIRFGLETSTKLLNFYENYFQIPYPLKKLDIISIPSFGPGAMENWGLITFRSERILINDKTSTNIDREKSFHLIAHELSHQWFGNLVTMATWTEAWLKEGFANNFGVIGGEAVDKTMGSKDRRFSTFMLSALQLDSYATSHPISTEVNSPNDIRTVFDVITYNKGSCLVGLLHTYLGDTDFRKGIQNYLRKYSYKNANQDDLWQQLSYVSNKNVKSVMDTWTLQQGYPLISVRRLNKTSVFVRQQKFSLDHPNVNQPKSSFGYIWKVPIIFRSPTSNNTIRFLLETKSAVFNVPEEYTILNPDHAIFYRNNYEGGMFASHLAMLFESHQTLTVQDRTGFISDQFNLVRANLTSIGRTLEIMKYLKFENDYYPWKVALDQLSYVFSIIKDENIARKFSSYTKGLIDNLVQMIGWNESKTTNDGLLQVLLLKQACSFGNKEVIAQSKKYFIDWVLGKKIDLNNSLYHVFRHCAISQGDDFFWEYAYLNYKTNNNDAILWSLTSTRNIKMTKRLLNYSLDEEIIDSQYTPYVISEIAKQNGENRLLCWQFIKKNWVLILRRYSTSLFMLSDLLKDILEGFSTKSDLDDVKRFFKYRDVGTGKAAINQGIQKIEGNILWKQNHVEHLRDFLEG